MNFLLTLIILFLIGCGNGSHTAGGNTAETGNSLASVVYLPNGKPATNAKIRLRTMQILDSLGDTSTLHDHNPTVSTTTDNSGRFTVNVPNDTNWILEVASQDGSLLAMTRHAVTSLTLAKPASLRGKIMSIPRVRLYVAIAGLQRRVACDSNGAFVLDSIPAGSLILQSLAVQDANVRSAQQSVEVTSGYSVDIGYIPLLWGGHGQAIIHIPAGMVDVDINGYPLLLRLDSTVGNDLTVLRQGHMLPSVLDHREETSGQSTRWIRVDSIPAKATADSLVLDLWWGNPSPQSVRAAQEVFSAQDGWISVLHLNDSTATIGPYLDSAIVPVRGLVGLAAQFNGYANGPQSIRSIADSLGPLDGMFVSGWVQADSQPSTKYVPWCGDIDGKPWILLGNDAGGWSWRPDLHAVHEAINPQEIVAGEWYFLAMWMDNSSGISSFSVNGATPVSTPMNGSVNTYTQMSIGCSFSGILDEVRFKSSAPSLSMLRLDAWIQAPHATAVVYKPIQ
jgi:hypothetical protein